jgi:hypothetical protein
MTTLSLGTVKVVTSRVQQGAFQEKTFVSLVLTLRAVCAHRQMRIENAKVKKNRNPLLLMFRITFLPSIIISSIKNSFSLLWESVLFPASQISTKNNKEAELSCRDLYDVTIGNPAFFQNQDILKRFN